MMCVKGMYKKLLERLNVIIIIQSESLFWLQLKDTEAWIEVAVSDQRDGDALLPLGRNLDVQVADANYRPGIPRASDISAPHSTVFEIVNPAKRCPPSPLASIRTHRRRHSPVGKYCSHRTHTI